eukprot:SAG31_NODE_834_length_11650_cov_7.572245_7_plen_93_part_00
MDSGQERDEDDDTYEDGDGTSVYFGNLPWDVEWKDLKDVASQAGTCVRADVMKRDDGKSKGWGICEYATVRRAATCCMHSEASKPADARTRP